MKLAHLSDLHIGRRFGEFDLVEDQEYILEEIIDILKRKSVDVVMLAGDIYDKLNPSEQAFRMWNDFLVGLSKLNVDVLVISGNHDSNERLGVGSTLLERSNIYIETHYTGELQKVSYDNVDIYMMPFIKPSYVRNVDSEFSGRTYHEAVAQVLENVSLDRGKYNVLMAHQFVVGRESSPILSDSESLSVGGVDAVGVDLFDGFDYVALGHIHRPQSIVRDTVRYGGSILKYSFSEANHEKSIPIITIDDKLDIEFVPLIPKRDVRVIKGMFDDLYQQGVKEKSDDIIHAVLEDDASLYNPITRLRAVYPNLLTLEFSQVKRENEGLRRAEDILDLDARSLINSFFEMQNDRNLNNDEKEYLEELLERLDL